MGTPLRMAKLARREHGAFGSVEFVVLDEADKLLGEAFLKQVDAILAACTHPSKARRPPPAAAGPARNTAPVCLHHMALLTGCDTCHPFCMPRQPRALQQRARWTSGACPVVREAVASLFTDKLVCGVLTMHAYHAPDLAPPDRCYETLNPKPNKP